MRPRWHFLLTVALLVGLAAGCGSGRDKGRNNDYDRPKATNQR